LLANQFAGVFIQIDIRLINPGNPLAQAGENRHKKGLRLANIIFPDQMNRQLISSAICDICFVTPKNNKFLKGDTDHFLACHYQRTTLPYWGMYDPPACDSGYPAKYLL